MAEDDATRHRLGFVGGERVERALVEARLGAPVNLYEGGRVVSYPVFLLDGRLQLRPPGECFGLMIEYSQDGLVVRRALVKAGASACPKG